MKSIRATAYRFSVAWPRIFPEGTGQPNRKGIDFYNRERFVAIDVSDSDDSDLGEKIAALQARNFHEHPEVAAAAAQPPSFTVPDGSGSAA